MKTAPTYLILASLAAITGLTSCGTAPEEAPTASSASASTSASTPSVATTEGDITDPRQSASPTHLTKAAAQIQDGVSTKRDVVRKLGIIYKKGTDSSGRATATWTFKQNKSTAKSFIPGSAFIPGAIITYYQSISIVLDANETVVSHQFLESTKEKTAMGFSYGS